VRRFNLKAGLQVLALSSCMTLACSGAVALAQDAAAEPAYRVSEKDLTMYPVKGSNVRSGPFNHHEVITTVAARVPLKVTGWVSGSNWYRIQLRDGRAGFIHGSLLTEQPPAGSTPAAATSRGSATPSRPSTSATPTAVPSVAVPAASASASTAPRQGRFEPQPTSSPAARARAPENTLPPAFARDNTAATTTTTATRTAVATGSVRTDPRQTDAAAEPPSPSGQQAWSAALGEFPPTSGTDGAPDPDIPATAAQRRATDDPQTGDPQSGDQASSDAMDGAALTPPQAEPQSAAQPLPPPRRETDAPSPDPSPQDPSPQPSPAAKPQRQTLGHLESGEERELALSTETAPATGSGPNGPPQTDPDSRESADAPAPQPEVIDMAETMYISTAVKVRAEPTEASEVLIEIPAPNAVRVTGRIADTQWYRIALLDGRTGYLPVSLLNEEFLLPPMDAGEDSPAASAARSENSAQDGQASELVQNLSTDWYVSRIQIKENDYDLPKPDQAQFHAKASGHKLEIYEKDWLRYSLAFDGNQVAGSEFNHSCDRVTELPVDGTLSEEGTLTIRYKMMMEGCDAIPTSAPVVYELQKF